jgi:predicted metalloprotease with PDZ domain
MPTLRACRVLVVACLLVVGAQGVPVHAQSAVGYRLSFPEREHRIMDVELTLTDLPAGPLQLRMSRSSPGRYAAHEFAKNVFDVRVVDAAGQRVAVSRPNPHQWDVTGHSGAVRVTYRVFGDRIDGTYLAIDTSHAHINMPAALMWARGLDQRPIQIHFEPPAGSQWQVATQLFPTVEPFTFTAPNLQYAMDSPSELSAFTQRSFSIADGVRVPTFRVVVHHAGDEADVEPFVRDVEKLVREARRVFGEFPPFDGGAYTFIADYLPWAAGDGMEHRNSTILTSASSLRGNRLDLLDTAAHEFFHAWNVERIRPRALEPFNLEDSNIAGELWFAEGFTNYYAPLLTRRAGLTTTAAFAEDMSRAVNAVLVSPGRRLRTAEEMSQHAPFVDAATSIDPTSFSNTFLSYYTWGQAIGLGLDLSLRERTDGRVTLDDVMRAMWQQHGQPGGRAPGYVDRPYTMADLRSVLAAVSGDAAFARDFFARFIQGHEVVDYQRLLSRAGFVVRPAAPRQAFAGDLRFQSASAGVRIAASVPFGSPAYDAGLDRDDVIVFGGGAALTTEQDVRRAISTKRPGDELPIVFERRGERVTTTLRLAENPYLEIVPAEEIGQSITEAQRRFREAWLTPPR